MSQLVILKFGNGNWRDGFPTVTAQLQDAKNAAPMQLTGSLPPSPELLELYARWRSLYAALSVRFQRRQIEIDEDVITNVSEQALQTLNQQLKRHLNQWLDADSFGRIERQMRTRLSPSAELRVIIETEDTYLRQFPWHLWNFFEDYVQSEVALSAPNYGGVAVAPRKVGGRVRILAILGNAEGIDVLGDQRLLQQLPDAEVVFLTEPRRAELNHWLWDDQGWDILFFAGHSASDDQALTGQMAIHPSEQLTIAQLEKALKTAIDQGLKLAIFNSCDGLGLARELARLNIPQIVVMREPVPDRVAQEFVKHCLTEFSRGRSFYQSVRIARERLQGLEAEFPCASWLPVICQNPAEVPPTWRSLQGQPEEVFPQPRSRWRAALLSGLAMLAIATGIRQVGWLQPWELKTYDQMVRLRPQEGPDPRLLVVAITDTDLQLPEQRERSGSLSDRALYQLLQKLEAHQPRTIGLDIYRNFPVSSAVPELSNYLRNSDKFFAVCQVNPSGDQYPPPPDLPAERQGFSNVVVDSDGVLRLHLLMQDPPPAARCSTSYSLSTNVARHYLRQEIPEPSLQGWNLHLGSAVFRGLKQSPGVYASSDTWGLQVVLNYRSYRSPAEIADVVTLEQILRDQVNPSMIRDRVVLIGAIHANSDYFFTPYSVSSSLDQRVAGVILQAQMVSQILSAVQQGRPLITFLPLPAEIVWIGLWSCWGVLLFGWVRSPLRRLILLLVSLGVLLSLAYALLIYGYWLPVIPPIVAIAGNGVIFYWLFFRKQPHSIIHSPSVSNHDSVYLRSR